MKGPTYWQPFRTCCLLSKMRTCGWRRLRSHLVHLLAMAWSCKMRDELQDYTLTVSKKQTGKQRFHSLHFSMWVLMWTHYSRQPLKILGSRTKVWDLHSFAVLTFKPSMAIQVQFCFCMFLCLSNEDYAIDTDEWVSLLWVEKVSSLALDRRN